MKVMSTSKKILGVFVTSGIAIAISAWIFHMQGRAYKEAYLGFFGIDYSEFSPSTLDLQWVALVTWVNLSVRIIDIASYEYLQQALDKWWVILVIGAFAAMVRISATDSGVRRRDCFLSWLTGFHLVHSIKDLWVKHPFLQAAKEVSFITFGTVLALFAVPAVILVLSAIFLFCIIVAVIPFDAAGRRDAMDTCLNRVATLNIVRLNEDYSDTGEARRLECSADVCAVLTSDGASLVPRSAILRIDVPKASQQFSLLKQSSTADFCESMPGGKGKKKE